MSTRWWAPKQASLTPDAVVLALMESDGDPAGDLGGTLLAAHRAGAGACEYVAKGAVPSEQGLLEALAICRANIADQLVTSVSKSVDSPSYAGLLVRDIFDDAEDGALALYQTCVAKGVSPPMAVTRAGAVFGVPSRDMGKYQQLAIDPKSNPVALADAADRVLLTYVSKMVKSETSPLKETVSKATKPVAISDDGEFDPREHPRGERGRFVNTPDKPSILQPHILAQLRAMGGGGQAAPTVGTEARPPVKRVERVKRVQRVERAQRVAPATKPLVRSRESARSADNRELTRTLSPRELVLTRAFEQLSPDPVITPTRSNLPSLLKLPAPRNGPNNPTPYGELDTPLIIGMSSADNNDFHSRLRDEAGNQSKPNEQIFRIGHLLKDSTNPESVWQQEATNVIDSLAKNAIAAASDIGQRGTETYVPPVVTFIDDADVPADIDRLSFQETVEWIENERQGVFTSEQILPSGETRVHVDSVEDDFVKAKPVYRPLRDVGGSGYDEMAIVHYQPADPDNPRFRPMPSVNEYYLASGNAIGYEDGTGKQTSYILDPNQAYKIVPPPGRKSAKPQVMWDKDRKIMVSRYYIRAIDESEVEEILGDVEKADQSAYKESEHPRDAQGHWKDIIARSRMDALLEDSVQAQPVQRVQRAQRAQRVQRVQRTANTPLARAEVTRSMASRSLSRTMPHRDLVRAIKAQLADNPKVNRSEMDLLPPLSDVSQYRLLNAKEYSSISELISREDFIQMSGGGEIKLLPMAVRRILNDHLPLHVDILSDAMRFNVDEELQQLGNDVANRAPIGEMPHNLIGEVNFASGVPDHEAIAERVARLFENDDKLDQVEVEIRGKNYYFYGNTVPASAQVLFQIDPDLDTTKPVVMTWKGQHRAHDVRTLIGNQVDTLADIGFSRDEETETQKVSSPMLNIFKITNPKVGWMTVNNE